MDRDQRPANAMQDLRDLQKDLSKTQGAAGRREPLTKASKGWHIPNMPTPDDPDDGGHLFVTGDEPYWIESNGTVTPLKPPPPPQASEVPKLAASSGTASDTISNVGGSYDQAVLKNNFRSLAAKINDLIQKMQDGDLMVG